MEFQLQQESGVPTALGEWSSSSSRRVKSQLQHENGVPNAAPENTPAAEEAPAARDETHSAAVAPAIEGLEVLAKEEPYVGE